MVLKCTCSPAMAAAERRAHHATSPLVGLVSPPHTLGANRLSTEAGSQQEAPRCAHHMRARLSWMSSGDLKMGVPRGGGKTRGPQTCLNRSSALRDPPCEGDNKPAKSNCKVAAPSLWARLALGPMPVRCLHARDAAAAPHDANPTPHARRTISTRIRCRRLRTLRLSSTTSTVTMRSRPSSR